MRLMHKEWRTMVLFSVRIGFLWEGLCKLRDLLRTVGSSFRRTFGAIEMEYNKSPPVSYHQAIFVHGHHHPVDTDSSLQGRGKVLMCRGLWLPCSWSHLEVHYRWCHIFCKLPGSLYPSNSTTKPFRSVSTNIFFVNCPKPLDTSTVRASTRHQRAHWNSMKEF